MAAMTNFARPGALALALILAAFSAPANAQTDEERSGARSAAMAGIEAYNSGNFERAADLFSRAESLMHAPTHLLFLGRSSAKLGRLVSAREYYLRLTQERLPATASKPFKDAQAAGDKELAELEPRLPYVSIVVQGAVAHDVQVTRDDQKVPQALLGVPHPEDPGTHTFRAQADGMESAPSSVLLKEGAHETVVLTLSASSTPASTKPASGATVATGFAPEHTNDTSSNTSGTSGLRITSYAAIGVGVVGVGIGAYFFVKSHDARSSGDELNAQCLAAMPMTCRNADTMSELNGFDDDANRKRNIGIATTIVGGAAVVTGVTLLVIDLSGHHAAASARTVQPVFGLNYAGLNGAF
jgi:hypothetical protein